MLVWMTAHADRFTGRVAEYVQYRQQYDAEPLLALLRAWCGLVPEQTVADIGAGTGMLAEVSLRNGNAVVAVEPNAAMRAACKRMQVRWPRLRVIDAAAELTTLAPQSIDLVSVGRAFHWFDAPRALAEFRRILKPGGWVALVSLGRAKDGSEMSAAYERLLTEHGTDYSYVREGYRVHEWLDELAW
jgi:ubiquinone/menaquinone biosynthesis C-methylase UbiE